MEIKIAFQKQYIYWVLGIFFVYLTLNIILSKFYITIQYIPYFLESIQWGKLILSLLFTIILGLLIAINMVLVYIKYKERQKNISATAFTGVGAFGGLTTGVCTACIGNILPWFFGIFGISLSWASLPFQGLEIQALLIVVLGANLYYLKNPISSLRSEGIFNKKDREVKNSP